MTTGEEQATTSTHSKPDLAPEGIAPDPLLAVGVDGPAEITPDEPPEGIAPDPLLTLAVPTTDAAPIPSKVTQLKTQNLAFERNERSKLKTAVGVLRWALGGLSLLAAFWGQALAEEARQTGQGAPPQISWIMFGVAGLLFAIAMWPVARVPAAISFTFFKTLRSFSRARKLLFLVPLGLSIILGLISLPLFLSLNAAPEPARGDWWTNTGSWLLYITAILLFAFAFIVWERSVPTTYSTETPPPGDHLPRRLEWVMMGALLLLALLLRVPG